MTNLRDDTIKFLTLAVPGAFFRFGVSADNAMIRELHDNGYIEHAREDGKIGWRWTRKTVLNPPTPTEEVPDDAPTTNGDTTTRAVNRLVAASIVHRNAMHSGQPADVYTPEFAAAVDAYLAVRTPLDAARDQALIDNPNASASDLAKKAADLLTTLGGTILAALGNRSR